MCISGTVLTPEQDFDVGMAWIVGKIYIITQIVKTQYDDMFAFLVLGKKNKSLRTTRLEEILMGKNHRIEESQNSWGWTGCLEII